MKALKHYLIFYFAIIFLLRTNAQTEDKSWLLGYSYSPYKNLLFDFNGDSLKIIDTSFNISVIRTNANICDKSGSIKMVTNGCFINDRNGRYVNNSSALNPGWMNTEFCVEDSLGYNTPGTHLFLGHPGLDSIYYLLHLNFLVQFNPQVSYHNKLSYTKVHYSDDSDSTWVSIKNQMIFSDSISDDGLVAVRHANGRDWWIVCQRLRSNKFYITLFDPSGLTVKTQQIGEPIWPPGYYVGQMSFSPDGTKLVMANPQYDMYIFDFDRSTGTFTGQINIELNETVGLTGQSNGIAFSADGHYLYYADERRIYQFDMWAGDIGESRIIIAEAAPPVCPLSGSLSFMKLGPDGIIYCLPGSGQRCLHRIKNPEKSGTLCSLQQHYYQFDVGVGSFPNSPNFRLGPIDGSACDTLGINNVPLAGFRYDPLPASPNGGGVVEFTSVSWYEPTDWLWDFGDGQQSSERNPVHTFNTSGAHDVCLTVSNQYGSDVKCKTVWVGTTSASDDLFTQDDLWRIYPNPTNGEVSVTSTTGNTWEGTILVTDGLGHQVLRTTAAQFSLASLPNGMYFVQGVDVQGRVIFTKRVAVFK